MENNFRKKTVCHCLVFSDDVEIVIAIKFERISDSRLCVTMYVCKVEQPKQYNSKNSARQKRLCSHIYHSYYMKNTKCGLYNRNKVLSLVVYNPR